MQPISAVIPAAGRGTRLFPLTYAIPKELLPLGPKPAIQLVVEELAAAGLQDFVVIVGKNKNAIRTHFEILQEREEAWAERRLRFVVQPEPLGLGHAILCAAEAVPGDLFVALGDAVIWGPTFGGLAQRMLQLHKETEAAGVIAVQKVPLEDTARYGIIQPGEAGPAGSVRIVDLIEKPGPQDAPSHWAICARYVLTHHIFEALRQIQPDASGEWQLTDALRQLARQSLLWALPLRPEEERWDVGSLRGYGQTIQRAWQLLGQLD